jgi:endonuclease YncB( thermonuclease family)
MQSLCEEKYKAALDKCMKEKQSKQCNEKAKSFLVKCLADQDYQHKIMVRTYMQLPII